LIVADRAGTIRTSNNFAADAQSVRSGGARSEIQHRLVSANVAHAVATVALELSDESVRLWFSLHRHSTLNLRWQLVQTTATMLLQKLSGTDTTVDGAIMLELANLAAVTDEATFITITKSISAISKRASTEDGLENAVRTPLLSSQ